MDRDKIDAVYLATTTPPTGSARTPASSRPLLTSARSADLGLHRLHQGRPWRSDFGQRRSSPDQPRGPGLLRRLPPGQTRRLSGGDLRDGGAALLLGDSGVIATIEGAYSVSHDFVDHWRTDEDKYNRTWEDRWIQD